MNSSLIIVAAVVTSMLVISILINKKYISLSNSDKIDQIVCYENMDSLEDDFQDIIGFIPLQDIEKILHNYLMYDKQIAETRNFIIDQKKFILQEFEKIPETWMLLRILEDLGLNIDKWHNQIYNIYTTLPSFKKSDPTIASGGLTVMISKMIDIIPTDELHSYLCDKKKYSTSFKIFLLVLRSPIFIDLCRSIEESVVLCRHYYWAKQDELEAIFAIELLKMFYIYLTEGLL